MKNWKRFIAACLSVTMVASIPLTAFAESSVSVKELVPTTSNESETQEETDLEKILSQEKPYEYFSGLKDQEKLLDACKDEELFQLKEYMKYAYIHESDLKNRQSLDAYLLISKAWKNRNVTFDKDEQEKLLQLPEKAKVYGTKFEGKDEDGKSVEKTVKDFSIYMEYLQSIKKFDVPKYMELLSAFDEVKTEEDLANAKDAFSNFEEETFGFDEQETEPVKEDSSEESKPEQNPEEQELLPENSNCNSREESTEKELETISKDEEKNESPVEVDLNKGLSKEGNSVDELPEKGETESNVEAGSNEKAEEPDSSKEHFVSDENKVLSNEPIDGLLNESPSIENRTETSPESIDPVLEEVQKQPVIVGFEGYTEGQEQPFEEISILKEEKENIQSFLDRKVAVYLSDGRTVKINVAWECEQDPFGTNEESYSYHMQLPEAYELSEELKKRYQDGTYSLPYLIFHVSDYQESLAKFQILRTKVVKSDCNRQFEIFAFVENSSSAFARVWVENDLEKDYYLKTYELENGSWEIDGFSYNYHKTVSINDHGGAMGLYNVEFLQSPTDGEVIDRLSNDQNISTFAVGAARVGGSYYATLGDAVINCASGSTVYVIASHYSGETYTGTKNVTIKPEGGNHTVYWSRVGSESAGLIRLTGGNITVSGNGNYTLTLDGNSTANSSGIIATTNATINLMSGVTLQNSGTNGVWNDSGVVNLNGAIVKNNKHAGIAVWSGRIEMASGTVWANGTRGLSATGANTATINVYGGIIKENQEDGIRSIANVNVYGGIICANKNNGILNLGGKLNLNGGSSYNNKVNAIWNEGTATINNVYDMGFSSWNSDGSYNPANNVNGNIYNKGTFTINTDTGWVCAHHSGAGYHIYNDVGSTFNVWYGSASTSGSNALALGGNSDVAVVNKGTFNWNKGNIEKAKIGVQNFGGATFTFGGGSVTQGGRGVSNSGTFNMKGGTISNNSTDYGAGISNNGTVNMSGGTISNNAASQDGGGIHLNGDNAVLNMSGGTISNNRATNNGGGIMNWNGTVTLTGGTISGNTGIQGKGIYNNDIVRMSGNGSVNTNNDVYLTTNHYITVTGALNKTSGQVALLTPQNYGMGRRMVEVAYGSKLGSMVYKYSDGSQKFGLTPNGRYQYRPGNYIDSSAGVAGNFLVLSVPYTVSYNKNTTDAVSSLPGNTTVFWKERTTIPSTKPSRTGYEFIRYTTAANNTGTVYNPGQSIVVSGNLTLYAQWKILYALDVNAVFNNQEVYAMDGSWLTFDVYINGSLYANDVADFCIYFNTGTQYEIKDIKMKAGKKYLGTTYNTTLSGTIGNANVSVWLKAVSVHTVTLQAPRLHAGTTWKWDIGTKYYTMDYGSKFNIQNYINVFAAPKGYHYGGASTDDWWETAKSGIGADHGGTYMNNPTNGGSSIFTVSTDMTAQLHYYPNTYTIKYNGNGNTGGNTANSNHSYDTAKTLTANGFTKTGYTFVGWTTKPDGTGTTYTDEQSVKNLTATHGATINLYAKWKINTYTNIINYYVCGLKNGEGHTGTNNSIWSMREPYKFNVNYGGSYSINRTNAIKIPNGFYLDDNFYIYNQIDGYSKGKYLPMGSSLKQPDKAMYHQFFYKPTSYKITYNLDGGTNNSANPSTYNVLYGVSLKTPTKAGYTFIGWYEGDKKITGINEGANASFADNSDLYNKLAGRRTGDVTLTAKWTPIKYTITYEGNGATGGSTPSSNHTYDKPQTLTPNGFHKDGYYFDSWNTKPDGTGNSYQDEEEVKNLTSKDGDTVTLHAQWKPIDYKIIYKGNGSTGGTEKTHLYNQKDVEANGYAVKTNKGYTDFVRTKHTFMGWYQNSVVDTKAEMAKIYKQGSKLTYSQLLAIHAEQVKKGLVKDTDPKVKEIILYAVWDEAPGITIDQNAKDKFYEGVDVTRADLLSGITANDKIDGSLTNQIIITRIDYSAGKLVNGKKQAAYSQTWENGMPADAKLDTWFMQLDKNDSPVTHTITYQVKDSAGNITTAKKTIQVVYNEFPVIKANDFRFTLDDAQAGLVTKDKLLEKAVASGVVSASDVEDGDIKSKIELIDFDANAFKTMKQEGFIPITYRVQDSMGPGGKGKVTLKTVNVNIYLVRKEETVRYVRFINKKYYEKNANLDRNALAGKYDQIALLSVNGGLHPFSVWYTDPTYRALITETFEKTKGTTYVYTKEDIKKMREFVKQHGVGNAKEEDALSKFADIFMTGDYILK